VTFPAPVRNAVLRDLEVEAVQAVRGTVPAALVRECAADIGAPSGPWSWWNQHRTGDDVAADLLPDRLTMQDVHIEVIFASNGNVSEAHRQLMENPETAAITPPRRTLAHWWSQVDAAVRAYAYDGAEGLVDKQMRARYSVEERNQLWRIDHQEFPVWVLPAGRTSTPVMSWVTTVIDDATRLIVSFLVTVERPDATTVGVVLADAVRLKPTSLPGVEVGGLPLALMSDNGGEFRSSQLNGMLRQLGIASRRSYPYLKHLNGKAEVSSRRCSTSSRSGCPGTRRGRRRSSSRICSGSTET
jgi:transposase InsO family protein